MTDLTRTKKLYLLDDLCAAHDLLIAQLDALKPILNPDPGCHLYGVMYSLLSELIYATALLIEDNGDWLSWAVWENDCCRKGYEAGLTGDLKPVRSSSDLLNLIEECNADV